MAIRNALIAVDFDGTVVTHAYPEIGDDAGAVPVLKELTDNGCRLILYTMRHGKLLDDAIRWFRERGIPLYAVNENPSQQRWTSSPKVHADLYIDDSSLGCPIRFVDGVKRPVADWTRIREQLVRKVSWTEPPRSRPNRRHIRLSKPAAKRHCTSNMQKGGCFHPPFAYAMPQPAIMPRGCGDICPRRSSSRSRPPARVCPPCR